MHNVVFFYGLITVQFFSSHRSVWLSVTKLYTVKSVVI